MFAGVGELLTNIGAVLGVNTIKEATDKLLNDDYTPEQKIELNKLNIQSQQLSNEDKANLRANNSLDNNKLNFTIANISANVVPIIFIVCGAFGNIIAELKGMLITGGISILTLYYGYWLGSSIGSSIKNNWKL